MFDLGAQELIVILIVAFLVFGPKRLPELGRTLGKGLRELKAAMRNVKDSIEESDLNVSKEIKDIKDDLSASIYKPIEPEVNKKEGDPERKEELRADAKQDITTAEEKKEKAETGKDG